MTGKKNQPDYAIALDLGTASVGWCAAFVKDYNLRKMNGKKTIGVRLFDKAEKAEKRREKRQARRQTARKKERIRQLDLIFKNELNKEDKDFLKLNKYSWVSKEHNKTIREENADKKYEINERYIGGIYKKRDNTPKKYPTAYHLRKHLIENKEEKADIRDIYRAIKHIIKHRGHFLSEYSVNSDTELNAEQRRKDILDCLKTCFAELRICENNSSEQLIEEITNSLTDYESSKKYRKTDAITHIEKLIANKKEQDTAKNIIKAIFGDNKVEVKKFFNIDKEDFDDSGNNNIKFKEKDFYEYESEPILIELRSIVNDSQWQTLIKLYDLYKKIELENLLKGQNYLSFIMCERFDLHQRQLQFFDKHTRLDDIDLSSKDFKDNYKNFLNTRKPENWNNLKKTIVRYVQKQFQDEEKKKIAEEQIRINNHFYFLNEKGERLFKFTELEETQKIEDSENLIEIKGRFFEADKESLFPTQRGTQNREIPHQIQRLELELILNNQEKHHKNFLNEETKKKIFDIFDFKRPYFVGPLVDSETGDNNFAFAKYNKEATVKKDKTITPYNYKEMFDFIKSQENFIEKLRGEDKHLLGEKTLPKHSLLYQEYEVLNEINSIRITVERTGKNGGQYETKLPLTETERKNLYKIILEKRTCATLKDIENSLEKETETQKQSISGFQDHKNQRFANTLSTYHDLKNIFGEDFLINEKGENIIYSLDNHIDFNNKRNFLEKIVEIQTIYGDEKSRKEEIEKLKKDDTFEEYQTQLTQNTVNRLSKIHYKGYGKFSKKLLAEIKCEYDDNSKQTVMEVMRTGYTGMRNIEDNKQVETTFFPNFQEVYYAENNFREKIDVLNKEERKKRKQESLNDQIGRRIKDPTVKRGVKQATAVVDDLIRLFGYPPKYIFIEKADGGEDNSDSRKSNLTTSYNKLLGDNNNDKNNIVFDGSNSCKTVTVEKSFFTLTSEPNGKNKEYSKLLEEYNPQNDKYYLYESQLGKDIYTLDPINLDDLNSFDIDHIRPRALNGSNSIHDNLVLTKNTVNAEKADSAFVPEEYIKNCKSFWKHLLKYGLITQKKYNALTRTRFSKNDQERFTARALVETRQIIENTKSILGERYEKSTIVGLKSNEVKAMRRYLDFEIKDRDINDCHHAHDAFCLIIAGLYLANKGILVDKEKKGIINKDAVPFNEIYKKMFKKLDKDEQLNKLQRIARNNIYKNDTNICGYTCLLMYLDELENNKEYWSAQYKNQAKNVLKSKNILFTKLIDFDGTSGDKPFLFTETLQEKDKKELIPLKHNKNVYKPASLYGGFTGRETAYVAIYCIITTNKTGKKKTDTKMITIHREEAEKIKNKKLYKEGLKTFIEENIKLNDKQKIVILKEKVSKGQLIIKDGQKMFSCSDSEMQNAQQLYLSEDTHNFIHFFINSVNLEDLKKTIGTEDNSEIAKKINNSFAEVISHLRSEYPVLKLKKGKSELSEEKFTNFMSNYDNCSNESNSLENIYEQLKKLFESLIKGIKPGPGRGNLILINPKDNETVINYSEFGRYKFAVSFSDNDALVYQSPTGLSEKRETIKQMKQQKGIL